MLAFATAVSFWQIICWLQLINPMFLPTPYETFKEIIYLVCKDIILLDAAYSLKRVLTGGAVSFLIGVPAGLLLGYYENLYNYVECLIDFFRSIPPIIVFPLALLIFGIGEVSRIIVIVFGCATIMMLHSAVGVRNSPKMRVSIAKMMGAKWHQVFSRVIIFDALPQIFIGTRVSLSLGVIIEVVTEMLAGAKHGLGSRAVYAQIAYNTPELYATIIFVGLIGFFINKGLILLEDRVIYWRKGI
ncbi:ABC transporter permease [Desulfocucumis palustris]|nr:ABC transporter permease [Desulfocucumis palustris]